MPILRSVALPQLAGCFDVMLAGGTVQRIAQAPQTNAPRWIALPSFCNLHAHANRAFTASAARPASLSDAVDAAKAHRAGDTVQAVRERAGRFFDASLQHGVSRVRTHTDVDPVTQMRAIDGVLAAAEKRRSAIDVEVVAFATAAADPVLPQSRALLSEAVARGASLIGSVPAMSSDPARALSVTMELARELGAAVDLHLDEHLDPSRMLVPRAVELTRELDLRGRVTISHACTLACLEPKPLELVLQDMHDAQIELVALPELNLYLQDRGTDLPRRRGVAPVVPALRRGVSVRLGTDNVRDWFFPFGDGDPLSAAYIAAMACHLDDPSALLALVCGGRRTIEVGDPADLVLVPVGSVDEAVATRAPGRVLLRRGVTVAGCPPAGLIQSDT